MDFVFFTDEEGTEVGIPVRRILSVEFTPNEDDHDDDELKVNLENEEYYEVLGKHARKAWEEIKIQIRKRQHSEEPT
jgi:hypothetical protein